jgi:HD-GYP domain-containing protein (c-di-GMP phosphodiesterase class II)
VRSQVLSLKKKGLPGLVILSLMVYCLSNLTGCQVRVTESQIPRAEAGTIDLRNWDFGQDGPVKLDGEWRFYWQQFIVSDQVSSQSTTQASSQVVSLDAGLETGPAWIYYDLPQYWNKLEVDGKALAGEGYASFALTILLPEAGLSLGMRTMEILTAHAVYIDGIPLAKVGQPGTDKRSSTPHGSPSVTEFTAMGAEVELVIQVSNFHHRKGGILGSLQLGTVEDIRKLHQQSLSLSVFQISSIFIIGLYHISLFLHRRKDWTAVLFGIFCLIIALRALTTGSSYIYELFPHLPWQIVNRIEYISFYLALPVFSMYLRTIFPADFKLWILRTIQITGVAFTLFVLLVPALVYTHSVQVYQVFTVLAGLYISFVLAKGIIYKRDGAGILLAGFIIMFATVINDVLHSNEVIYTGFFVPMGLLVFIFSQAYLISLRFTKTLQTVERQTIQLIDSHAQFERSRIGIIMGLAKLAEYRDEDTGLHLERIREYCRLLASRLSLLPAYKGYITEEYINDLYYSSILHDIGKVGVPDAILLKPGRLDPDEFRSIQRHPGIGGDAIMNVESKINIQSFLTLGREIAYCHHEKWDGTGYPKALKGEAIPLSARIVAIADVYDALTSERPYKEAFPHNKALGIIADGRASHFDPVLVDIFLEVEAEFDRIRLSYQEV